MTMMRAYLLHRPARALASHLRRPGTLGFLGMACVTAAIAVNALFLQSGRHPAPLFDAPRAAAVPAPQQPDEIVRAVQSALRDAGYYEGPLDGLPGARTSAAIEAFEQATGRPRSGRASAEIFAAIRAAAPAAEARAAASAADAPATGTISADPRVFEVQSALARAAYGPLHPDGMLGPQTRDAIIAFQKDHDLPVTGEISDALIVELRAVGALGGE